MLRGGSWINNDPSNLRCCNRNNNHPDNRNNNIGFRCVVGVSGSARKESEGHGAVRRGGDALRRQSQEGLSNPPVTFPARLWMGSRG